MIAVPDSIDGTWRESCLPRPSSATPIGVGDSGGSMKQLRPFVCVIAIAFAGIFAMAQTPTGTIQGLVTDKTGAAIQGVSITIVQTATNEIRNTVTDASGRYNVP